MELNATALIDDYLDDELDEVGTEQLRQWLEADPKNVRLFVRHVYLHRQLRDTFVADNTSRCLASDELSDEPQVDLLRDEPAKQSSGRSGWFFATLASVLLLGAIVGSGVTWKFAAHLAAERPPVVLVPGVPDANASLSHSTPNVATLVNVTNCRWDQSHSTASLSPGSVVRSGESLHLMEGAAEINLSLKNGGMAALQLEGPLAMTLNSQGMPNLLYGHLAGTFACDYDRFTLDTPLGRVNVSGESSVGVIAAANKVEVHVFSGNASLELWTIGVDRAASQMTVAAGSSISAHVDADGSISIEHGKSREAGFLTPAARTASQLHISPEYVSNVVASKPVAYWRFEGDVNGVMRNEMGDRLNCRLVGDAVRWHPGRDGSSVEFGATAGPGYLLSDDTFTPTSDAYSVELWAKPKYVHHATLFSFLQWEAPQSPVGTHRMVLEVCGPVTWLTSPFRATDPYPGRVRFVQECKTNVDVDCYSPKPYTARQWQHLAAVKTPEEMRLYLNGQLVASKQAPSTLSKGLRVLMGQLLPVSPQTQEEITPRIFSGELDEVALYDRVLSEDDIKRHFELVHQRSETNIEKGGLP